MEKHPLDETDLDPPPKRQRQEDGVPPDQQLAPKQLPEDKLHDDGVFCDDCRAVNWSSLPTLAANGYFEFQHLNLRPLNAKVEELRNSSCRICAFLSMKKPWNDEDQYVLKALPLAHHFSWNRHEIARFLRSNQYTGMNATRCPTLGITEETDTSLYYLGPSLAVIRRDDLESRRIPSSSVDYERFKGLARICEEEHDDCRIISSHPNVLGLEVIDTRTQEVIKAPDQCKYVALSYVWGKQADDSSVHNINDSPLVIKDAVSVTTAMGYNYLWVDRYCISDSKDKRQMISQMDQIYANASITIIAAADGDTDMGLCGVSMPRQPQQQIDIQDVSLLELPLGSEGLTSSKWATRGWTYQEGYLSTRRLIFTNTQVLFLCNGMYSAESLQRLLNAPFYTECTFEFRHFIPNFSKIESLFTVQDLQMDVEQYSLRELTRSDDSLDAFLGVLSYYSKRTAAWTSPVLSLPWGLIANKHANKDTFSLHFFWHHENSATRRGDFPSWSWTGWGGHIKFRGLEIVLQPKEEVEEGPFSYLNWDISVQYEDCRVVKMYDLAWQEFEARKVKHRLYQPGPKKLQVSCLAMPVSFRELEMADDQKHHRTDVSIYDTGDIIPIGCNLSDGTVAIVQVWKGIYVGMDQQTHLKLDQQVEKQDCILGLITASRFEYYDWTSFYCLLVRQVVDGLYERVGWLSLGAVDLDYYQQHPPTNLKYLYKMPSQMVFLDSESSILNKFSISERQRNYPFRDTAETRTICLV